MSTLPGKPKRRKDSLLTDRGELYLPRDFRAGTEAVERDTDSAWASFQEMEAHADRRFADTAPLSSTPQDTPGDRRYARTAAGGLTMASTPALTPAPAVGPATVEDAMVEARRNNRVCPKPERWQELFAMLPDVQKGKPPPPLVGSSWANTPSLSKRMCLREHLEWAAQHGRLDAVLSFMRGLPETDWFHMGD
ncbi:hypothetical protein [Caenimonas sp. SL110]|uniref:hypothetical protein n=1 Tax=Caenimonas sp. SL110 TaxID=1450524 RepID=UPI00128D6EF6|nr:hypothetical protein [Caenimonas sp. SL110]